MSRLCVENTPATMYIPYLAIIIGLVLLVWSADRFVIGAAATARKLGMPPLLVGLTIVSVGTSAPEMFVSAIAALQGSGNLSIGNALGSNITNIALVLGATLLVSPIPLKKHILKKELPLLITVTATVGMVLADLKLSLRDAVILLTGLCLALYLMFLNSRDSEDTLMDEEDAEAIEHTSLPMALFWLAAGIATLIISSKLLVYGATDVARSFGISELVIGLTIVAIGTSLPELAASISSAVKGHHDIAIGAVIGSNLFNLLAVMPLPGLVGVTLVEPTAFYRDYLVTMTLTLLLMLMCLLGYRKGVLGRLSGSILVTSYVSYLLLIYYTANS